MKINVRGLLAASVGLLMLASIACGAGESDQVSVKLALDWYPNSNHLGLFIAEEKGYFAEENLVVNMYTPVDPSTVLQTVGAGSDDFGISYQPELLMARAQGVPVVSIAGMVQHPLNSVVALASSGITRPADLKGKKVGYAGLPTGESLLDTMLKYDGLVGLGDVELVNVGFDLAPVLISGTVDAVVGAYWTHETILLENAGYPVVVLRLEEWGVPDYYELVMVASEDKLAQDPQVVERFLRAVRRGYADALADPQAGVDVLLRSAQGEEVDVAIERPGADLLKPVWKTSKADFGEQDSSRWQSFADWMHDNGLLAEEMDASKAFTSQFEDSK
ncbi:MAG: hypothetical protein BZY79_02690 [SAR202 cluster bacterium Casp-Chloro-G4]|nr:ABC transporter substrate-binding protein [Chloroflexota bacterium]PKB61641.1 MAG: hypothetical protein BZY79_02690 [SAR202 cluster bacterium Casp-Chloro-G4]